MTETLKSLFYSLPTLRRGGYRGISCHCEYTSCYSTKAISSKVIYFFHFGKGGIKGDLSVIYRKLIAESPEAITSRVRHYSLITIRIKWVVPNYSLLILVLCYSGLVSNITCNLSYFFCKIRHIFEN